MLVKYAGPFADLVGIEFIPTAGPFQFPRGGMDIPRHVRAYFQQCARHRFSTMLYTKVLSPDILYFKEPFWLPHSKPTAQYS